MVFVPNSKDFKIGDFVRFNLRGVDEREVAGKVTYIHPTNGWLTILVTEAYTRSKVKVDGGAVWKAEPHKVMVPYSASAFFSEVTRMSESPVVGFRKCWRGGRENATAI